jgi:hypothetical protein
LDKEKSGNPCENRGGKYKKVSVGDQRERDRDETEVAGKIS